MISIVIPYYNRRQLLINVLQSIDHFKKDRAIETIIVDDGSDKEHQIKDIKELFPNLNINLIVLERTLKWRVGCIAINEGLNAVKGNIVLLNSSECIHIGDIIGHVYENITSTNYISYSTYQSIPELNSIFCDINWGKDSALKTLIRRMKPFKNDWQVHSKKPAVTYIPFCAALTRKNMEVLSGYDERFVEGVGYDDYDFTDRLKNMGLKLKVVDNPFVVHQWHTPTVYSNTINIDLLWELRRKFPYRIKAIENKIYVK